MCGWPIGGGGAIGGGPMRGWPIGGGAGGGLMRGWPIGGGGAGGTALDGGAAAAPIFAPHCGQNDPWACAPQFVQKAMV
jgi:hypothetical protein